MLKRLILYGLGLGTALALCGLLAPNVPAQETFKIAFIDPLTGPFANVGELGKRHFEFFADRMNARGGLLGRRIEVLYYDSQVNPKVAVEKVAQAIDDGARIVTQGNSSAVANAITEAVLRYNVRHPGQEVLYLNYSAIDPALTNDRCNFWHFRFDANADIKMKALVNALVKTGKMHKVYIIGQNYSAGQAVALAAERELSAQAPGVQIVANELHPLGKVKDFSPYIAKIKQSGADTVITQNWGNDMILLIRAAADAGLKARFATYYANGLGAATAMGDSGRGALNISEGNLDDAPEADHKMYREYKERYKDDFYFYRIQNMFDYLELAVKKANSLNAIPIAKALEGMELPTSRGRSFIRKDDHQIFLPLYVSEFTDDVKFPLENTKYGWKTVQRIEAEETLVPTTCAMERPS